ncbi:MAG TPA: hypothetical protein VN843_09435, partial [Anaerolineales bacterium]|nr:hypothetical protein [Anaerolineales bacterium]
MNYVAQYIYLFTIAALFTFAFVIFLLLRRFKISHVNEWARPFAWSFFVLAVMYSIRFGSWALREHFVIHWRALEVGTDVGTSLCSSLSNYLLFRVALTLTDNDRRIRSAIVNFFHIKPSIARFGVFILLLAATMVTAIEQRWTRIPDVAFSMLALFWVGLAFYRHISVRRDPLMAYMPWLALIATTTIGYAALHLIYAFSPYIDIRELDAILFGLALPLKFGLFFSGYALIVMIVSPTENIRRLLQSVTHGPAEFLDPNGVPRSIWDEI